MLNEFQGWYHGQAAGEVPELVPQVSGWRIPRGSKVDEGIPGLVTQAGYGSSLTGGTRGGWLERFQAWHHSQAAGGVLGVVTQVGG